MNGAYQQGLFFEVGLAIDAPITPNFPSGSSREIVGDYVEK